MSGKFSNVQSPPLTSAAIETAGGLLAADVLRSYLASTITYNNDDTLGDTASSVTVEAGGIYQFNCTILTSQAVRGVKIDFGGTATAANFVGQTLIGLRAGSGADIVTSESAALGTDMSGIDGSDGNFIQYYGTVEVDTGGTLIVRGAQTAADASNTTILRGSTLVLTKMN